MTTMTENAFKGALVPPAFLALGTFAIGTESFMIAPLLPVMAADFGRSVSVVALLVVVFTLVLALSSPISTVLTGRLRRRSILLGAMGIFATGNLLAAFSETFAALLVARVMMAVAAGLYIPAANGLAGVIVPPHLRGRALAFVSAGQTLAIAFGLPLGGVIGHAFGWRATFLLVAVMSMTAILGILTGIPRNAGSDVAVPGLHARVALIGNRAVLRLLAISLFWSVGAYAAYPYLAEYLAVVLNFGSGAITATVSLWGVAAAAGVLSGGALNDRFGADGVVRTSLAVLGLSFLMLAIATAMPPNIAFVIVLLAVALWGFTVWSFFPAQMARLVTAGGRNQASVALALNTSTMYLGFSLGSGLGAMVLAAGAIWGIGAVAAVAEAAALRMELCR
ncbi:MFS transporter [Paroceanicella profunda]|uniref:MFS transporter n=1 Tax=Paroceanicella profunda TaxID=2579971 RepID=A0A5B8FY18_9RHOB|nr:MFS transporter [Paroceanicella profunda]QDL91003.1 MFS transporter [Paroceanicella profunda]